MDDAEDRSASTQTQNIEDNKSGYIKKQEDPEEEWNIDTDLQLVRGGG